MYLQEFDLGKIQCSLFDDSVFANSHKFMAASIRSFETKLIGDILWVLVYKG